MELFNPDITWPQTAHSVKVFKLYYQFILSASDSQLTQVISFLKARNIALAVEVAMLTPSRNCGRVEGYASTSETNNLIQKLKHIGADLKYIAMDEPLWFGHRDQSVSACRSSIASVAQNAADTAAMFRHAFPNVQVGDIEPLPADISSMIADMKEFAETWKVLTGDKLAFMNLDLSLMVRFVESIQLTAVMLQEQGIPLGIIYNGSGADTSDADWLSRAEQRYESWEEDGRPSPEIALFQSWNSHPSHVLPETTPLSFTNLVLGYGRSRSSLQVVRASGELQGRLTDASGFGVGDAKLFIEKQDTSNAGETQSISFSGKTPDGAYRAVFVVRINDAECTCVGPADVDISQIRYTEPPVTSEQGNIAVNSWHTNTRNKIPSDDGSLHVSASTNQNVNLNSNPIFVNSMTEYVAGFNLRASLASQGNGYVGLVFLNRQGRELARAIQPFSPAVTSIGTAITSADGTFKLKLSSPNSGLQVRFKGNREVRGRLSVVP